jgi:hypothetical protein
MGVEMPRMETSVSCSHCGSDLNWEDGWCCTSCGLVWPDENPFNEDAVPGFMDDENLPCGAEHDPPVEEKVFRTGPTTITFAPCTLPAEHRSEHFWPTTYAT